MTEQKYAPFVASVILINSNGEVLLGKRTEDGIFTPPGGGSNEGETPEQCAVRETFEEAGILVDAELLQALPTIELKAGKICYPFLYVSAVGKEATSKLDPDQEVKKWVWYPMSEIPDGLRKDQNRFKSVCNAYMKFKGIFKSLNDALEKGGEGSGKVGHITAKDMTSDINKLAEKLSQPSPYRDHYAKLKEGAVMEGVQTRSGKPVFLKTEQALSHGYEPEDYREVSNMHYDKAEQMQKQVDKMKALGRIPPKEMQQIANFHVAQFKENFRMAGRVETRREKTSEAMKERAKVNKSEINPFVNEPSAIESLPETQITEMPHDRKLEILRLIDRLTSP